MEKINIRKGVFETNSSSTHSVCIPEDLTDEMLDTIVPNEDGILELYGGEFGGGGEVINDAITKANYLAVYCKEWYPEAKINDLLLKDILINVIKKQTGCSDVSFDNVDGYIDHQSVESEDYHWLFKEEETMRNFIFNKEAELTLDYNG
jgi:hypothetical protein